MLDQGTEKTEELTALESANLALQAREVFHKNPHYEEERFHTSVLCHLLTYELHRLLELDSNEEALRAVDSVQDEVGSVYNRCLVLEKILRFAPPVVEIVDKLIFLDDCGAPKSQSTADDVAILPTLIALI